MPSLIQALCWSKAALHCPSTSAWKWLDGKTPPRALPTQKGLGGPSPSVSFTPSFSLLLYFCHPFDPKVGAGGMPNLSDVHPSMRAAGIYLPGMETSS